MKKIMSVLVLLFASSLSFAGVVQCDDLFVDRVMVQGDRSDHFIAQNKAFILLSSECFHSHTVYVDENNNNYSMFLAIAMSAFHSDSRIGIVVNDDASLDGANQLAAIWVVK